MPRRRALGDQPQAPSNHWSRAAVTIRESMPRSTSMANQASALTSGRLHMVAVWYEAGDVVTALNWWSSTTALATGSNQWAALFDSSRNRLALSADATSGAWAGSTEKTFTLTAPYTIPARGLYYHGLVVVATTVPSLHGITTGIANITGKAPILSGFSSTGLTNPASCPATAAALTAVAPIYYTSST